MKTTTTAIARALTSVLSKTEAEALFQIILDAAISQGMQSEDVPNRIALSREQLLSDLASEIEERIK